MVTAWRKSKNAKKNMTDKRKDINYKHTVGSLIILTLREIKTYVTSILLYQKTVSTNSPQAERFISKT